MEANAAAATAEDVARLVPSYGLATGAQVRECLAARCGGRIEALPRGLIEAGLIAPRALEILYDIAAREAAGDVDGALRAAAALRDESTGPPPERTPELEAALANPRLRFGAYVLVGEIGRGGMGVVYRAWHVERQRYYALKTILAEKADDELRRRFELEARTLRGLRHSNIIRAHDQGEVDGRLFYAMDFIEGRSLSDYVQRDKPTWQASVSLVAEAALATHFAHSQGVIHRDIKPANILVDLSGRPFLVDFGLARGAVDLGLTMSGQVMGSPAWMAPEQMEGRVEDVDARSDVYALGGVLYFALTGRKPYEGTNIFALMQAVQTTRPPAPTTLVPELPKELDRITMSCLEKEPERRPRTAFELAASLRKTLLAPPPAAAPAARPPPPEHVDALTKLSNRRHLLRELEAKVPWKAPIGPVSLLLLDLDQFKVVNDTRGREAGDRALARVAELLRQEAGPGALLGRHGGDSFLVALFGQEKAEAVELGRRLRERVGTESAGSLRLSGGAAAFPEDAQTLQLLVNATNKALACAKLGEKGGISAYAREDETAATDASLLATLPCAEMVGRDAELASAIELFDDLCNGRPGLLRVTGGEGFGKTRFLREYAARAQTAGILHLYVACDEAKARVPAYPLLRFLDVYFEKHPVAEQTLRLRLNAARRAALREYVPAFSRWTPEPREALLGDRLRLLREAVETALALMASESPLLLIVDNAGLMDKLTAEIALSVLRERKLPLGVAMATKEDETPEALAPLLSRATRTLSLPPLAYDDIERMFALVLPGAEIPEGLSETVAEASCGNPLYVEQLLRRLMLDGRVHKKNGRWTIPSLGFGELPESLDAAVREMMAQLPADAGNLLTNAAVIGASFDFRALKAMSGATEGEMLDLMDKAEEMGLVERGEGQEYGFQAGHLREVRYRAIPEGQRRALHKKAAEALIEIRVFVPGAGGAEYHAARGRGEPVPARPEAVEAPAAPAEAAPGEQRFELLRRARVPESKTPVPPPAAETAWVFLGALAQACKTVQLYPGDARRLEEVRDRALAAAKRLFGLIPQVTIAVEAGKVLMNGQIPATAAPAGARQATIALLAHAVVGSLTLRSGLSAREMGALVSAIANPPSMDSFPSDHWEKVLEKANAENCDVLQRRYVATDEEAGVAKAVVEDEASSLSPAEVNTLWDWLRYLKATVDNTRLYPGGHKLLEESTAASQRYLGSLLDATEQVVISTPEGEVVVNGVTLDVKTRALMATWLTKELEAKTIRSLSLTRGVTPREHGILASALAAKDAAAAERFLSAPGLEHLKFDSKVYERVTGETIKRSSDPNAALAAPGSYQLRLIEVQQRSMSLKDTAAAMLEQPPEEFLAEANENALPGVLASLVGSPHAALAAKLMERAVSFVKDPDEHRRRRGAALSSRALREAGAEAQKTVLPPVQSFLEKALVSEAEKPSFASVADVCSAWLGVAGAVGQHDRIVLLIGSVLRRRPDLLDKAKSFQAAIHAVVRLHEAALTKAVRDRMADPDDPAGAAAVKMSAMLGPSMSQTLATYVRQVKDAQLRREAAQALGAVGGPGAALLAAGIRPGGPPDEILKLLAVLELTGLPDVGAVVASVLGHADPAVRVAALALFRRAPKQCSPGSLRALLRLEDPQARIDALTVARDRRVKEVAPDVAALCGATEDEAVLRFACYYFRECPSPQAIPPLRKIFELRSRIFGMRKGLSDETRAAAVEAASRVDHPEAAKLLQEAAKDRSDAVKETARRTRRFGGPA